MSSYSLTTALKREIHDKLESLAQSGAAPGFQLALGYRDQTLGVFVAGTFDPNRKKMVKTSTWFDLASLTKILAICDLYLRALQSQQIADLDQPLKTFFPFLSSELKNRTLSELLNHRAGLSPIFEATEDLSSRTERVSFFLKKVDETYDVTKFGVQTYSDVGFMLLGLVLESIYGKRLRQIYGERDQLKFGPISCTRLSAWFRGESVASIQSLEPKPRWLLGEVQDPRAAWLGGDSGHSGLFGTALGIENWAKEIYASYQGKGLSLSDKITRKFIDFEKKQGSYVNGFDTPLKASASDSAQNARVSQAGSLFPSTTIGHLGFTGTSFWMDMETGARITLLSQRFFPGIDQARLSRVRPAFHDWIAREVFFKLK